MPCCGAAAVPKTSSNFLKFFAHYSEECSTSPESQWHIKAKDEIVTFLKLFDIEAKLEQSGESRLGSWKADVYFEIESRKVAIEIQHSYQHLRDYLKRQLRYSSANVECYWILYRPRYITLTTSISKYRIKHEFGGEIPSEGLFPCIPELPLVALDVGKDSSSIIGAAGLNSSVENFLYSILEHKFIYQQDRGAWIVIQNS
nr:competence protein CoiA family protein [Marinobacterium sedimentorum]